MSGDRPAGAKTDLKSILDRLLPVEAVPASLEADRDFLDRMEKATRPLAAYFKTEVVGAEKLPPGGALLVSNHGPMAFDAVELVFGVYRKTKRVVRGLTERQVFRIPAAKKLMERLGHVAGTPENAVATLRHGDLVLVYPGGARDAFKGSKERYRLQWQRSAGFVRVALEAEVPIVPVAGIGVDDYYEITKEPEEVAETFLGRIILAALGDERYVPPSFRGFGPIPKPARLTFIIGDPIFPGEPPEAAKDPARVEAIRGRVKEALESLIIHGLIRRGV